jgi:hypothetical protein
MDKSSYISDYYKENSSMPVVNARAEVKRMNEEYLEVHMPPPKAREDAG